MSLMLEGSVVRKISLTVLFVAVGLALVPVTAFAQAATEQATPSDKERVEEAHEEKEAAQLDCSDIATQRGAQALFELASEDRFDLDRDGDGVACENQLSSEAAEDGTRMGAETGRDLDCMDFPSQKAAQAHLRDNPFDPYKLDPENSGIACQIRPANYENLAVDNAPVAEARSNTDLDCEDFEYQQEAQMVYFGDKSDPNDLDKGERGSAVCLDLPVLASNADATLAVSGTPLAGDKGAPAAPLLVESWPHGGGVGLLLDLIALLLVVSGVLVAFAIARSRRRYPPRSV